MAIRASTEVGPVRVSVGAPRPVKRRALATGLRLPRKAELPPPVAPAGWYPDPEDAGRMRWWTGTKWTRRFAEPGAAKVSARVADAPPKVRQRQAPRRRVNSRLLEHTKANLASYPRKTRNSRRG